MRSKKYIKIFLLFLTFSFALQPNNVYATTNDWIYKNDNWYYGSNNNYLTGWQKINNKWYYFDRNGIMLSGWQYINNNWYYLNNDMKTGWIKLNDVWYYLNSNGSMQIGWKIINNKKYFFDANGKYIEGVKYFIIDVSKWQGDINWEKVKNDDVDGVILRSTYGNSTVDSQFGQYIQSLNKLNIPYGIYHYNTATTTTEAKEQAQFMLQTIKSYNAKPTFPLFVDIEENGNKKTSSLIAKSYCDEFVKNNYQAGIYANTNYWTNYLVDDSLDIYYKWVANYGTAENNKNGTANPNFVNNYNIQDYILWQYSSHGSINGISGNVDTNLMFEWYLKMGWYTINNNWYYYNSNGYLTNGWQNINNKWYYMNETGVMLTNWQKINNNWYYLNNDMKTGWQKIDNKWYYLADNGAMLSGWQKINNKWYYLNNDMKIGWQKVDNKWYYLADNGAMLNGWQYINDNWYYLNNDMKTGWIQSNNKWYYLNDNGCMMTGKQEINDKLYVFDNNGALIHQDNGTAPFVYVTLQGAKYHSDNTCSQMSDPIKVSQTYAMELNYTACKKCY